MKRRKISRKKLLIVMLIAVIVIGVLLFAALVRSFTEQKSGDNAPLMFSENTYVVLTFALLLPICLVAMIKYILKSHTSYFTRLREEAMSEPEEDVVPDVKINRAASPEAKIGFLAKGALGRKKEEEKPTEPRFYMLDRTDKEYARPKAQDYDTVSSLSDICESFRNFSASRLGLYYSIDDINRQAYHPPPPHAQARLRAAAAGGDCSQCHTPLHRQEHKDASRGAQNALSS
jgi:hypothetical protein